MLGYRVLWKIVRLLWSCVCIWLFQISTKPWTNTVCVCVYEHVVGHAVNRPLVCRTNPKWTRRINESSCWVVSLRRGRSDRWAPSRLIEGHSTLQSYLSARSVPSTAPPDLADNSLTDQQRRVSNYWPWRCVIRMRRWTVSADQLDSRTDARLACLVFLWYTFDHQSWLIML